MIFSMTGFGKTQANLNDKLLNIELKSINSKTLDLQLKINYCCKEKEIEIRKMLNDKLKRGKIELLIYQSNSNLETCKYQINNELVENYLKQLKNLNSTLTTSECLKLTFNFPDSFIKTKNELNEEQWKIIKTKILETIDKLNNFRKQEGLKLKTDIQDNLMRIRNLAKDIDKFDKTRISNIKDSLIEKLANLDINYDKNRLEQELIFYLEKLDINEEKVRLEAHLNYFNDTIESTYELLKSKKLCFISQEINREINTIGSKANNLAIQKIVIEMKNELEKIKEQLYNIL